MKTAGFVGALCWLPGWIVRSVPLEIVGSSGREGTHARGKPGLERPGETTRRGIERSCGERWTHSDSFNDTSRQHVWDQLKRQMPSCHSVHDLELAVQDFVGPSASGQHKVSNPLNAAAGGGPTRY
ncbi:hypothetical protein TNCV_5012281 [Trichonephila clavipes]|nr:hypothetical protein TNCV_5012281 [Trichonephila clavipes]